jgi:hypothetical protein
MLAGIAPGPAEGLALPGDQVQVGRAGALNDHQLAGALQRVLQFVDALAADVHVVVQGGISRPGHAAAVIGIDGEVYPRSHTSWPSGPPRLPRHVPPVYVSGFLKDEGSPSPLIRSSSESRRNRSIKTILTVRSLGSHPLMTSLVSHVGATDACEGQHSRRLADIVNNQLMIHHMSIDRPSEKTRPGFLLKFGAVLFNELYQ